MTRELMVVAIMASAHLTFVSSPASSAARLNPCPGVGTLELAAGIGLPVLFAPVQTSYDLEIACTAGGTFSDDGELTGHCGAASSSSFQIVGPQLIYNGGGQTYTLVLTGGACQVGTAYKWTAVGV